MKLTDLQNKLVAVLGFGLEGKATTQYLLRHGIKPVLFDHKAWSEWTAEAQNEITQLGVNFIFGPDYLKELSGFDVIFRSPGINLTEVQSQIGTDKKTIITSQTIWFFENSPAKIVGITGTKGKGTTASLIYEMLVKNSHATKSSIYLTGNIGKIQPFEILDNLTSADWIVYELSSFQLQDLKQSPHIGVVLMTTSEHLDYHKDQSEYIEAKSAIVKYQNMEDFAVINADYENSRKIGQLGPGKKLFFSRQSMQGDCCVKNKTLVLKDSDFNFDLKELGLVGEHNYENACAAVLAARAAGCDHNSIKSVLKEFKGLEHRLEFVTEKHGIKFYNDSFSTTPETAIAAINAFTGPEILILGGSSKNSDFKELAATVIKSKNIKALILVGKEGEVIQNSINAYGSFLGQVEIGASNMEEIFIQIKKLAQSGDIVLLSPACASFGMFENYKDRGNQFKKFALNYGD